ncbi:hypothetical protein GN956_G15446 [Arapaima gigas]
MDWRVGTQRAGARGFAALNPPLFCREPPLLFLGISVCLSLHSAHTHYTPQWGASVLKTPEGVVDDMFHSGDQTLHPPLLPH